MLVSDRIAPKLRRLDCEAPSPALRQFESRKPPVVDLRELGFEVLEQDSPRAFLDEYMGSINLDLSYPKARRAGSGPRPLAVRLRPGGAGAFVLEEGPRVVGDQATPHGSAAGLSEATELVAALVEELGATVKRISLSEFEVHSPDGDVRRVVARSVVDLLRAEPALGEIDAEGFTHFRVSPVESFSMPSLVSCLSTDGEFEWIGDLLDQIDEGAELPDWVARLADAPSGWEIAPAIVAGHFIAVLEDTCLGRPVLVDVGDEIGLAEINSLRRLAGLVVGEENAMVSGTSHWSLDLVAENVKLEVYDPDEGPEMFTMWRTDPGRPLENILDWLVSTSDDLNLDLMMLATETLIGERIEYGARFADEASESLYCSLSIGVGDDEIETFLEMLRERGRGDCVDAIRDPDSEAADARRRRLERD